MAIFVLAGEWVGIFLLVEVAQGVVYAAVYSLIGLIEG